MTGRGDGLVSAKTILKPPSLVNAKIKGWQDGGIYHVITMGRGLMGSFAAQIPDEKDRWALVHFIRRLQAYAEPEDAVVSAEAPPAALKEVTKSQDSETSEAPVKTIKNTKLSDVADTKSSETKSFRCTTFDRGYRKQKGV